MHIPVSTAMLGKTTSAVARIRKNMKAEFIATFVAYAIILILLFHQPQIPLLVNINSILLFILIILNSYYFFRFYIFYKSISRYDFSIKDSVRKIAYELELNTEIYKTFNFCVTPLVVLLSISLACSILRFNYIEHILALNTIISLGNVPLIFLVILIFFVITYIVINWYVRLQYGKYITELKQIMDDLGDEG
jgi:hypothetical protein